MTIEQILDLDCRKEENDEILQKHLKEIKPLAKCKKLEYVPFYKIEKTINVLSKKYNMRIKMLISDVYSNVDETIWKAILVDDSKDCFNTMCIIYGLSLYEVFAKVAIYMYSIRYKVGER